jgi:HlyD family secretion protein
LAGGAPAGGAHAASGAQANGAHAAGAQAGSAGNAGNDRRQVWVLHGDRPAPVSIHVGVSDGSLSELVDGDLHEGDEVITDVASGEGGRKGGPRFRGF